MRKINCSYIIKQFQHDYINDFHAMVFLTNFAELSLSLYDSNLIMPVVILFLLKLIRQVIIVQVCVVSFVAYLSAN